MGRWEECEAKLSYRGHLLTDARHLLRTTARALKSSGRVAREVALAVVSQFPWCRQRERHRRFILQGPLPTRRVLKFLGEVVTLLPKRFQQLLGLVRFPFFP